MSEHKLFNTNSSKPGNLMGVGINGKHPQLGFNVAISEQGREAIATALIGAARKISKKDINNFKEGKRTILTKELQMKGKVAWDTAIQSIIHQSSFKDNLPECSYINEQRKAQDSEVTFVRCPKCLALEASNCRSFQHNDLDTQQRCIECGKLGAVMDWLCNCDTH